MEARAHWVVAALLLSGCAAKYEGKTIGTPADAVPPPPVVERTAPGAEVRQAGEVMISAQETLNRVGGILNPTRPGVAEPAGGETRAATGGGGWWQWREPEPTVTPEYDETRALGDRPQPQSDAWDRSAQMYWWNKGGDAFHTNRECPYLKADAVPVVKGLAMTRRPCRTCGSPGTRLYQGGGSR